MTPPGPEDAALVAAARSGSDAAFARLVDRHQQAVRTFLRRVCANEADADDMAQETFLAAWSALDRLGDPGRLKSWLFGIAWRKAKTGARSAARSRAREQGWMEGRPTELDPKAEMKIAMDQAMAELPADQRASIALCLAGGWSHVDAAALLEIPLGTLKSHITRGRARLAARLGVQDEPV